MLPWTDRAGLCSKVGCNSRWVTEFVSTSLFFFFLSFSFLRRPIILHWIDKMHNCDHDFKNNGPSIVFEFVKFMLKIFPLRNSVHFGRFFYLFIGSVSLSLCQCALSVVVGRVWRRPSTCSSFKLKLISNQLISNSKYLFIDWATKSTDRFKFNLPEL